MIDALIHIKDLSHFLDEEGESTLPSGPIHKKDNEALVYLREHSVPLGTHMKVLSQSTFIGKGTADRVFNRLEGDALATYKRLYNTEPYTETDPETGEEETVTPPFKFGMLAEGNKSMIPQSVTNRQAKQQLVIADLYQDVVDYIDAIEDPKEKDLGKIWFDNANTWERDSETLNLIAQGLNLSDEEIDNLFIAASEL